MKRTAPLNKPLQYTIIYSLFFIGFMAVCFLGGEEAPNEPPMPITQWILIKCITIGIIAACILIGKYLYRKGYISVMFNDNDD